MNKWEFLGIPVLMLSDYYLTILGSTYANKKYRQHFVAETYELNPVWRKDVDNIKWINYKHLIAVAFMTLLLWSLSSTDDVNIYYGLLGYSFTSFGLLNGRHINNILLFKYLIRHPDQISGKVHLAHLLVLRISQFQTIIIALPILILTILQPTALLAGSFIGCISLYVTHILWIGKHKRKLQYPDNLPAKKESAAEAE